MSRMFIFKQFFDFYRLLLASSLSFSDVIFFGDESINHLGIDISNISSYTNAIENAYDTIITLTNFGDFDGSFQVLVSMIFIQQLLC